METTLSLFHTDIISSRTSDLPQYQEVTIGRSTFECGEWKWKKLVKITTSATKRWKVPMKMAKNFNKLKTHSGEKPNKCNQCDYASSQSCSLKQHTKIPSGETPHKCYQRDFASSYAAILKIHMKKIQWGKIKQMQSM